MINPKVFNVDKSESFIAIVLDDVLKMGLSTKERSEIESAVKLCGKGSTIAGRYFLREGRIANTPSLPKKDQFNAVSAVTSLIDSV